MNNRIDDIWAILKGEKSPTAKVVTEADSSWDKLALNFWLYALAAFVAGLIIYKLVNKD